MELDLERFVQAQTGIYAGVLDELRRGRKTGHWMWFVFPQMVGLGRSEMSRFYGIRSLAEARAYVAHPVLGPRVRDAARVLLELHPPRDATAIFGSVDAVKLRSSMTLFAIATPDEPMYGQVLARFFGGEQDPATVRLAGEAA